MSTTPPTQHETPAEPVRAPSLHRLAPELVARPGAADTRAVLVWRFDVPVLALSSAPVGGGLGVRRWIVNVEVPRTYRRTDLDVHVADVAAELACSGDGVGMLTAAPVSAWAGGCDTGAEAVATVGLSEPTWAAAADEEDHNHSSSAPGTVNLVVWVPARLSDAALVNAVATVTEAKTQALFDAGVAGTGTPSDAVCVVCPAQGTEERFAGPRSRWGAPLARAVHHAVSDGARRWLTGEVAARG